jgi:hypothetical protein
MTIVITQTDETAEVTAHRYDYTLVAQIAGRTVRARVVRASYLDDSLAVTEVSTDQMTWATLAAEAPSNWWHTAPAPSPDVSAAGILSPIAERLLNRAAGILAIRPITLTVSPVVHSAIGALLATAYGYDAECALTRTTSRGPRPTAARSRSSNTPTAA